MYPTRRFGIRDAALALAAHRSGAISTSTAVSACGFASVVTTLGLLALRQPSGDAPLTG